MDRRDILITTGAMGITGLAGFRAGQGDSSDNSDKTVQRLNEKLIQREKEIIRLRNEREKLQKKIERLEEINQEVGQQTSHPWVNLINPVKEWNRIGDVVKEGVNTIDQGENLLVAYNYTFSVPFDANVNQPYNASVNVDILTIDGDRISTAVQNTRLTRFGQSDYDRRLVEYYREFDGENFDVGRYRIEVSIEDTLRDVESETLQTTFRVKDS